MCISAAAKPLELQSRYTAYPSADSLVKAVEEGTIDVVVGSISITRARSESVAFTHPWMHAGIGIATLPSIDTWPVIQHMFSRGVLGVKGKQTRSLQFR